MNLASHLGDPQEGSAIPPTCDSTPSTPDLQSQTSRISDSQSQRSSPMWYQVLSYLQTPALESICLSVEYFRPALVDYTCVDAKSSHPSSRHEPEHMMDLLISCMMFYHPFTYPAGPAPTMRLHGYRISKLSCLYKSSWLTHPHAIRLEKSCSAYL